MQYCFEQFMKIRLALIHYENEEKIYPFEKFQNVTLHRRKQTRYILQTSYINIVQSHKIFCYFHHCYSSFHPINELIFHPSRQLTRGIKSPLPSNPLHTTPIFLTKKYIPWLNSKVTGRRNFQHGLPLTPPLFHFIKLVDDSFKPVQNKYSISHSRNLPRFNLPRNFSYNKQ